MRAVLDTNVIISATLIRGGNDVHDQLYRGYWTRGQVISHFIGNDGTDYYGRVTQRLGQNLMLGFEENRGFRTGDNGLDHLLRLELTRSFR